MSAGICDRFRGRVGFARKSGCPETRNHLLTCECCSTQKTRARKARALQSDGPSGTFWTLGAAKGCNCDLNLNLNLTLGCTGPLHNENRLRAPAAGRRRGLRFSPPQCSRDLIRARITIVRHSSGTSPSHASRMHSLSIRKIRTRDGQSNMKRRDTNEIHLLTCRGVKKRVTFKRT